MQNDMLKRLTLITATLILALALCGSVSATSDIGVTKTVNNSTPNVGDTVNFTITLTNNGPDEAAQVYVQDYVSTTSNGLQYVSHSATQGTYDQNTGLWNITNFANGATATLILEAYVTQSGNVTNIAAKIIPLPTAIGGEDPNPANDMAAVTMTVPPAADIAVEKEFIDDNENVINTANYGDTVYIIVKARNNGPDNATGVVIFDMVPSGLNRIYSGMISYDGGLSWDSNAVYDPVTGLWTIGDLPSGAEYWLAIETNVTGSNITIMNYANVSDVDQYDWNNTNNNTSATLYVPPVADLVVTKIVDLETPNYLDTVTFTVTVTNNGPEGALNTRLSDLLPAGFILVSAIPSVGSYDNVTGVWTIGDLGIEDSATLTLQALVNASNRTLTNIANASSDSTDLNNTNNQASVEVTVPPAVDISVEKEFRDDSYEWIPVNTLNYHELAWIVIKVRNNGPNNATGVLISDTIPSGLVYLNSYMSYDAGSSYWYNWAYNNSTGIWTIGDIPSGAEYWLAIELLVNGSNMTIVNNANLSAVDQYDWNSSNNNTSANLIVPPAADIAVTKEVDEPNPDYLDTVTFTVTVSNNGPDTAVNVLLSDLLPDGFSLTSATPSVGSYDNVTGVWTVGDLANGTFATLQLVAQVIGSNATITNYANASSDTYDWYWYNNSATVDVTVPPAADVVTYKEFWEYYFEPITSANYHDPGYPAVVVRVTNNGPDSATGVQITDLLPAGLEALYSLGSGYAVSWDDGLTWDWFDTTYDSSTGIWNIGTMQNGDVFYLLIPTWITAHNTTVVNWANKTAQNEYDWNTSNDNATASLTVPPAADIGVDKRVSNEYPLIGNTITFTIYATNYGPDDATGVQIFDLLPAGVTFVSATATQGTYDNNTGIWVIGNMSAFSVVQLDITVTVNPANGSSNVTNNASVDAVDQHDWYTQNDESSATIYLPISDLSITKSADKTSINVGEDVLWTVTLTNNGPANATNIVVTDLLSGLPTWYNINAVNPSVGSFDGLTGIWTIPSLANGTFATLVINMTALAPSAGQNIVNTANVTGQDQFDPTNATANATVYVKAVDIVVNKTVNNSTPNYRSNVTFTVTAHNNGPENATGVVITDVWPAGLTLVSATPSVGSYNNATGVWTIGNLNNGATATLTLVAQVMDANKTITNVVNLTAVNEYDTNTANNGSFVDIVIPASADIAVTKTTNSTDPLVCENFQWTVTVVNNGPNDATGVVVTDLLPAGLNLVSVTPSQGTYNNATGVWTVGTLLNGSTATLVFVTNATAGLSGVTVTNTANKTVENQYDWNSSNNMASASITVPAKKTFTLAVKNNGSGRIHAIYYVTIYQPCTAPIFKKYEFYLNAGQSTSFNIGTFVVGANISTDEFVYNAATSVRTVNVANTWTATGIAPYVQNFVVANVPANQARAAHAMARFKINRTTLGVQIVVPPHLL